MACSTCPPPLAIADKYAKDTKLGEITAKYIGQKIDQANSGLFSWAVNNKNMLILSLYVVPSILQSTIQDKTQDKEKPDTNVPPMMVPPYEVFYHGSDIGSLVGLLNKGKLDSSLAGSLKHAGGDIGFYLAKDIGDAIHFGGKADMRGYGAIQYMIRQDALISLYSAGAQLRNIAPDRNYNPAGPELFIPPQAFPVFNSYLSNGGIIPTPVK